MATRPHPWSTSDTQTRTDGFGDSGDTFLSPAVDNSSGESPPAFADRIIPSAWGGYICPLQAALETVK